MDIITEILSREEKIKSTVDPAEVALLLGLTGQEFKKIREAVINCKRFENNNKNDHIFEKAAVNDRLKEAWKWLDGVSTAKKNALAEIKQVIFYLITTIEYQQREIKELREAPK